MNLNYLLYCNKNILEFLYTYIKIKINILGLQLIVNQLGRCVVRRHLDSLKHQHLPKHQLLVKKYDFHNKEELQKYI